MKKKYAGYTLVEVLIVLLLASLFVGLPVTVLPRFQENLSVHQFFNQFDKNILLTQQSSLFSDAFTDIYKEAEGERRLVFDLDQDGRIILPLPPGLTVKDFPLIRFNKDTGSTSRLAKIYFTWQSRKQQVVYTFLLGKGHYEKEIVSMP